MNHQTIVTVWAFAALVASASVAPEARGADTQTEALHLVAGTLSKLDLTKGRGLLTTDLGRPIYFDVPNPYLFENVTVGARIALRLDDHGRAVKVMDSAVPDLIGAPDGPRTNRSLSAGLPDEAESR